MNPFLQSQEPVEELNTLPCHFKIFESSGLLLQVRHSLFTKLIAHVLQE
jgi:hypothetical protein